MIAQINKSIRSPFLWLGVLLLATAMIYARVAGFGYITGADQDLITRNPLLNVAGGIDVWKILTSQVAGTYQPLCQLSLALDMSALPQTPSRAIHLSNLILHLINIILFFLISRKLFHNGYVSLFMAGILALHPINIAAVAWMSSRGILLSSAFMLVGTLTYISPKRPGLGSAAWPAVIFILALLSHPLAIVFPLVIVFIDRYRGKTWKEAMQGKTIYFLMAAIMLVIVTFLIIDNAPGVGRNMLRLLSVPYVVGTVFLKFFIPVNISSYAALANHWLFVLAGIFGIVALVAGAWIISKKTDFKALLPMSFFILSAVLAVFISWNNRIGTGNQYLYISGAGLIMMMGGVLDYLIHKYKSKRLMSFMVSGLAVSIILILAGITQLRIEAWRSGESFWTDVIRHHPDEAQAFFLRGDHYALNGDLEKARFDYRQCIRRDPAAYMAMNNLGLIFLEENDLPMALAEFEQSIAVRNDFYMSRLNRGITLMRLGKNEEALASMDMAISLNPSEPLAYYNRGLVYERLNALDNAIDDFTRAIRLNPAMLQFYKDRGKAYTWKKDFKAAEEDYTTIIGMDPANAEMWFRRSLVRSSQDKFKGALEDALKARSLGFPVEEEYIRGISVQAFQDELPAQN